MKIAYLLMAHKQPSQVARLVTILDGHGRSDFYIHVDARSTTFMNSPSVDVIREKSNVVFVTDRVPVYWGGYSVVEATLRLLRRAVETNRFDYAVLLSGQDFPIKSNGYVDSFFELHAGKEFISYTSLPPQVPYWGPSIMERIECYWWVDEVRRLFEATGSMRLQKWGWGGYRRLTSSIYRRLPSLKRKFLPGMTPYGGATWFAISFLCARYVLDYVREHPEYCKFFRHTLVSDELFFHTLILNSKFRGNVVSDSLRFTEWEAGASSPRVLTLVDFDRLVQSDTLFARKIEMPSSAELLEKLIEHIAMAQHQEVGAPACNEAQ